MFGADFQCRCYYLIVSVFLYLTRVLQWLVFMSSAKSVANYYIAKGLADAEPLTPMKLIKLVYLAHCWHLKFTNDPLIDEQVQAWKYGPVIPSLYHSLKKWGDRPILEPLPTFSLFAQNPTEHPKSKQILDKVYEVYRRLTALQISTLTHQEGTPWWTVWEVQGGKYQKGAVIPNDLIRKYFGRKDGTATAPRGA